MATLHPHPKGIQTAQKMNHAEQYSRQNFAEAGEDHGHPQCLARTSRRSFSSPGSLAAPPAQRPDSPRPDTRHPDSADQLETRGSLSVKWTRSQEQIIHQGVPFTVVTPPQPARQQQTRPTRPILHVRTSFEHLRYENQKQDRAKKDKDRAVINIRELVTGESSTASTSTPPSSSFSGKRQSAKGRHHKVTFSFPDTEETGLLSPRSGSRLGSESDDFGPSGAGWRPGSGLEEGNTKNNAFKSWRLRMRRPTPWQGIFRKLSRSPSVMTPLALPHRLSLFPPFIRTERARFCTSMRRRDHLLLLLNLGLIGGFIVSASVIATRPHLVCNSPFMTTSINSFLPGLLIGGPYMLFVILLALSPWGKRNLKGRYTPILFASAASLIRVIISCFMANITWKLVYC